MHKTADRRMFAQLKVKLAQGIPSMVYIYKTKKEVSTIFSVNTTCAIHTCEIQPWERRTTKSSYPILLISEKVTRWTHQNSHIFVVLVHVGDILTQNFGNQSLYSIKKNSLFCFLFVICLQSRYYRLYSSLKLCPDVHNHIRWLLFLPCAGIIFAKQGRNYTGPTTVRPIF